MVYTNDVLLLHDKLNDVEEIPGPAIFDMIGPTTTVSVDYKSGNATPFGEDTGEQCVELSHQIEYINLQTYFTLNIITGNDLYSSSRYSGRTNDCLL